MSPPLFGLTETPCTCLCVQNLTNSAIYVLQTIIIISDPQPHQGVIVLTLQDYYEWDSQNV